MATYYSGAQGHVIYPVGAGGFPIVVPRQADRTYAEDDVIRGPGVERDLKICDAIVSGEELDTNASPTATAKLRLNHLTESAVNLVAIDATTLGTADWVVRLNLQAALGFVVPDRGYWLELVFDDAFATAAAGTICFGITVSPTNFGAESPLAPTGG
jgi:hypothetical protein